MECLFLLLWPLLSPVLRKVIGGGVLGLGMEVAAFPAPQTSSYLQAMSSLCLERLSRVWFPPSRLPCWPCSPACLGRSGAPWGAWGWPRSGGCRPGPSTQHPAPYHTKILGTVSGLLKEPPGFVHLTENKRPRGRLGFCSEVCFLSANSPVGRGAHSASLFVQPYFLKGTHPTNARGHDLLQDMVFHPK